MSELRQHLVFAIIKFLEEQIKTGNLKEEDLESLEVATQCLETAFGLDQGNKSELAAKYQLPASLLEVFQNGLKNTKSKTAAEVSAADKEAADKLKAEGNEFMKVDKIPEAVGCYSRAIDLDKNNSVYYCNRAAAYNKLNQFDSAIEDCSIALKLDPQYSKAYNRKGVAHMSLHQFQEAKDSFTRALELDPQNESYKMSIEQVEQRLQDTQQQAPPGGSAGLGPGMGAGGLGGMNMGGLNLSSLLNNPALMNMASSMMSNPAMQQMMANVMMGGQSNEGAPEGLSSMIQAGQQLAQEVQARNPDLVEQLRQQMQPTDGTPGAESETPPDPNAGGGSDQS